MGGVNVVGRINRKCNPPNHLPCVALTVGAMYGARLEQSELLRADDRF